jgi:membrane-bound lytic murein transglycosylase D
VRILYKVKSGDSFGAIASKFQVSVSDIKSWNNIHKNRLIAGQKLSIYVSSEKADKYNKKNSGKTQPSTNNKVEEKPVVDSSGKWIYYTVKSGDNFWSISKKYSGVTVDDLLQWNGLDKNSKLKIGQKLKVKK